MEPAICGDFVGDDWEIAVSELIFPASEETPGQAESRTAYQAWLEDGAQFDWWQDYLDVKTQFPHFGNWRIWIYIAWAGSPEWERQPATEAELAEQILRCTDRAIRKWKARSWKGEDGQVLASIEEAVAWMQAAPLLRHRRDVIEALVSVAKRPDHLAHSDRKLFLQMTGDFTPKQEMSGPEGGPIVVKGYGTINPDDWDADDNKK